MAKSPDGQEHEDASADSSDEPAGATTLRERVEEQYDFDDFTPAQMAEMTVEEWEAAFDPESWITGSDLLDRVEADLRDRVARRELFAVVERDTVGDESCVLAYTDVSYALVRPDGSVEGEGSILEDVEPVVALCSMAEYDVPDPPEGELLPDPESLPEHSGELGNLLLQVLAVVLLAAGGFLLVSPLFVSPSAGGSALLTTVVGLGFAGVGVFLFLLVANARLSDRFRAEEYRRRLRAAGVGTDDRPAFLPVEEEGSKERTNT